MKTIKFYKNQSYWYITYFSTKINEVDHVKVFEHLKSLTSDLNHKDNFCCLYNDINTDIYKFSGEQELRIKIYSDYYNGVKRQVKGEILVSRKEGNIKNLKNLKNLKNYLGNVKTKVRNAIRNYGK